MNWIKQLVEKAALVQQESTFKKVRLQWRSYFILKNKKSAISCRSEVINVSIEKDDNRNYR